MAYREPLCADCDGIGDYRCGYHQEKYDDVALGELLDELYNHFYDEMETEMYLFELGSFV